MSNGYFPDIIGDDATQQPDGLSGGSRVRLDPRTARTLYATAAVAVIAAGATAQFQIQVQVPMRIEQLVIFDETNGLATIARVTKVQVGPNSQIVSNNAQLPAIMFHPQTFLSNLLKGNTAVPGSDVIIEIFNNNAVGSTFVVSMKGTALVPG